MTFVIVTLMMPPVPHPQERNLGPLWKPSLPVEAVHDSVPCQRMMTGMVLSVTAPLHALHYAESFGSARSRCSLYSGVPQMESVNHTLGKTLHLKRMADLLWL